MKIELPRVSYEAKVLAAKMRRIIVDAKCNESTVTSYVARALENDSQFYHYEKAIRWKAEADICWLKSLELLLLLIKS